MYPDDLTCWTVGVDCSDPIEVRPLLREILIGKLTTVFIYWYDTIPGKRRGSQGQSQDVLVGNNLTVFHIHKNKQTIQLNEFRFNLSKTSDSGHSSYTSILGTSMKCKCYLPSLALLSQYPRTACRMDFLTFCSHKSWWLCPRGLKYSTYISCEIVGSWGKVLRHATLFPF